MSDKKGCVVRFRLGEILNNKGMTQSEASDRTGISRQALIKLVRDPLGVKMETLGKLCAGLGLEPTELFEVVPESPLPHQE